MVGITTQYQFAISSKVFKTLTVYVDRYTPSNNHIVLDFKRTPSPKFIKSVFGSIPYEIQKSRNFLFKIPLLQKVKGTIHSIKIAANVMRVAMKKLTKLNHITADDRSDIADALKELELSLSYQKQLSSTVTPAQRELLESFIDPYTSILQETMEPWEIKLSLEASCNILKIPSAMTSYPLNDPNSSSPLFVINKQWSLEVQQEVSEALYMISTVLTGKANLESALRQSGENLPDLSAQKKVVMKLVCPLTTKK